MSFFRRWGNIIEDAKKTDHSLETGSGFGGFIPFLALVFGWIPAIFTGEKAEDIEDGDDSN